MKSLLMLAVTPFMVLPAAAQYQYHNASYFASPGNSPVVGPPTVITTAPQMPVEHNSSKKSCKESMVDLFLFSVRRTTGDCTP